MIKHIVVGAGYVGLPFAVYLKTLGEDVSIIDVDPIKLGMIAQGNNPLKGEPLPQGFMPDVGTYGTGDVYWVCVPTPSTDTGVNLDYVFDCLNKIQQSNPEALVIIKSTIPQSALKNIIAIYKDMHIGFSPEFLVQGNAYANVKDTSRRYLALNGHHKHLPYIKELLCFELIDINVACHIKTLANNLLATRLQLINTYALNVWKDVVLDGLPHLRLLPHEAHTIICQMLNKVGADPRIGVDYLDASIGYGGSCLNKDLLNSANALHCADYMDELYGANNQTLMAWYNNILWYIREYNKGKEEHPDSYQAVNKIDTIYLVGSGFSAITKDTRNSPTSQFKDLLTAHFTVHIVDDLPLFIRPNELVINCRGVRKLPCGPRFINLVFQAGENERS